MASRGLLQKQSAGKEEETMSNQFDPGNKAWGPNGLPFNELPPEGEDFSVTDPTHPHDHGPFGNHYDSILYRRIGGHYDQIDKMHINEKGDILDH
jgi:hypothetical protein